MKSVTVCIEAKKRVRPINLRRAQTASRSPLIPYAVPAVWTTWFETRRPTTTSPLPSLLWEEPVRPRRKPLPRSRLQGEQMLPPPTLRLILHVVRRLQVRRRTNDQDLRRRTSRDSLMTSLLPGNGQASLCSVLGSVQGSVQAPNCGEVKKS